MHRQLPRKHRPRRRRQGACDAQLIAPPLSAPRDFAGWIAVAALKGNTNWGVLSTLLGHVRELAALHCSLDLFGSMEDHSLALWRIITSGSA